MTLQASHATRYDLILALPEIERFRIAEDPDKEAVRGDDNVPGKENDRGDDNNSFHCILFVDDNHQESRYLINTNNYAGLSERTDDNVPAHGAERRLQYQLIIGKKLPTDEIRCCINPERRRKLICPQI